MIGNIRPSSLSRTLALVPPAIALVAQQASGAFDIFIKIGDIEGESTDDKHPRWIQLQSFEWGVKREISTPTPGVAREAGDPSITELTIAKKVDKSTPALFLNVVGGSEPIPEVILLLQEQTSMGGVFYRITLNDVLVSSQSHTAAAGGDDKPRENISLNFLKFKIEYFTRDESGKLTPEPPVGYDLSTAKPF